MSLKTSIYLNLFSRKAKYSSSQMQSASWVNLPLMKVNHPANNALTNI